MAKLTGLEIYKLLPQTNCGDCNFPTCMAFAMQVAAKKVGLADCPHVSEEAKASLAEATAPPMRTVTIGAGDGAVTIGGETVLFRHEEKFHHPTALGIRVTDADDLEETIPRINELTFDRVGQDVAVDLVALEQTQDATGFAEAAQFAHEQSRFPLALMSEDPDGLRSALETTADGRPLVYAASSENADEMGELAQQFEVPLAVRADTFDGLADLTTRLKDAGVEDLVLDPAIQNEGDGLVKLTQLRRLALEQTFRPLGYPVMGLTTAEDPYREALQATTFVCKYGSLVLMSGMERWQLLPVITARFNVFTDPQVPNAVEPKLYTVGEPTADSPVLLTTNFALTYFTVETEVANSKVPAYIAVVGTDGLGVLNAYADDTLTGEAIAKAIQNLGAMDNVDHNTLVLPGLVAVLKGEVEDEAGVNVAIGPEEAAGIPAYLKSEWANGAN